MKLIDTDFWMLAEIDDVRYCFAEKLRRGYYVTDKTGSRMLETVGVSFVADEPTIFGEPNEDYIRRELEWYMSMSLNVNDIPGKTPEIWKQVSDEDGFINSNYGWCVYSDENYSQIGHVVNELTENPNSRRAIAIYTRPSMWKDYNHNGMSDFMCTNTVQYMIRDERLIVIVQMRSNDVVYGYRNDYAWQKSVADNVSQILNLEKEPKIVWQVGSLHVYEHHFHLVYEPVD